ncbi:hypothetical protein B0O99DRAFT_679613 [Bisporella sp. PMI_857]|nr:hypothetical protein B0O99DRAFT_679613 [Bisporella sp. PMI_857]
MEFIASIGSLITLVGTIMTVSRKAHRTGKRLKSVRRDIRRFAVDMDVSGSAITTAHGVIREYCQKNSKSTNPSSVIKYIGEQKVLVRLVRQGEDIAEDIKEVSPRIESLESRVNFVTRLKWVIHRSEIEAIGPQIEKIESTLDLTISLILLETRLREVPFSKNDQEIAQEVIEDMLDDLAYSVMKHGTAPKPEPQSVTDSVSLPLGSPSRHTGSQTIDALASLSSRSHDQPRPRHEKIEVANPDSRSQENDEVKGEKSPEKRQ